MSIKSVLNLASPYVIWLAYAMAAYFLVERGVETLPALLWLALYSLVITATVAWLLATVLHSVYKKALVGSHPEIEPGDFWLITGVCICLAMLWPLVVVLVGALWFYHVVSVLNPGIYQINEQLRLFD